MGFGWEGGREGREEESGMREDEREGGGVREGEREGKVHGINNTDYGGLSDIVRTVSRGDWGGEGGRC